MIGAPASRADAGGPRQQGAAGMPIHATCIAVDGAGVLLLGPSGAGKSDLALRLIDDGARLVADDRVLLTARGDRLIARAPVLLRGLLEVRGFGLIGVPAIDSAPVLVAIDLVAPDRIERLPEPARWHHDGLNVPRLALAPFEASAPAKLRLAVGLHRSGKSELAPAVLR